LDFGRADEAERERVRRALGLSQAAVVTVENPAEPAAFRFLLGENYNPCFDPTAL
jgi:hypothetical protein